MNYGAPKVYDTEPIPTLRQFQNVAISPLTIFASGHGFAKTSANGTFADDTTDYILGTQSYKLTTDGAASACFADATISAFSLTGKYLKVWVKVSSVKDLAELWFLLSSDAFTNFYTFKLSNDKSFLKDNTWQEYTFSFGDAVVTGTPNRGAITKIRVRGKDQNSNAIDIKFNGISAIPERSAGVVSVCFDDGLDSLYTKARPYMDKYGFKGTAYIIPELVDTNGYSTLDQLKTMQKTGWEIAAHHDGQLEETNLHDLQDVIRFKKQWMLDNGFNGVDNYAYSNGRFTQSQLHNIYRKWFRTCRSIVEGNTETYPPADTHRLRILNITNVDTTVTVNNRITQAVNNKEWLIMVFHGIADTVTDSSTQTSTTNFQTHMDNLNTSGIRVMPVGAVINGDT